MAYDSTVVYAFTIFGGKYHYLISQSVWVMIGLLGMMLVTTIDYHRYPKYAPYLLGICLVMLLLVFVPGIGVATKGAHRWLSIGGATFQPSELAKLVMVVYLASWFSTQKAKFTSFLLLLGAVITLVVVEPNLSTAMIISGIAIGMYFVSGAPFRHFIFLMFTALTLGTVLIFTSQYRLDRLKTYVNPASDQQGLGYHVTQIKIALGSGGLLGKGIGHSRQKYDYLPEVCTDSIFAIVGEELGFLGGVILVLALILVISRAFTIASRAKDTLGKLLAAGVATWFMLQTFVNLSAMVGLIPLTGVTLPFISCGGSAIIVSLLGAGVLLRVSKESTL